MATSKTTPTIANCSWSAPPGSPPQSSLMDRIHHHRYTTYQSRVRNRRFKESAKTTPWLDYWEWNHVGQTLVRAARNMPLDRSRRPLHHKQTANRRDEGEAEFDDASTVADLCAALDRVAVWRLRADNKLPHAVESSYHLAQILQRDYYHLQQQQQRYLQSTHFSTLVSSAEELRLAYSSAILRAINGVADALQQQRSIAQSVAVLCSERGLPSWLVDIRHEATHNQLPNLSVLRLGATTLLEYFDMEYWKKNQKAIPSVAISATAEAQLAVSSMTSCEESLVQLLVLYKQKQSAKPTAGTTDTTPTTSGESSPPTTKSTQSGRKNKKHPPPQPVTQSFWDDTSSSSDDEDDQDEEVYLDALHSHTRFWGPTATSSKTLGTTTNRFAALQEATISSTKKRKGKDQRASISSGTQKKKKRSKGNAAALQHAKEYVKESASNLPVAYSTALTYLVWGGGLGGTPVGRGVMIPGSVATFPETDEGIVKVRQRYSPLLVVLGKEWPGFLSALLVHLVAFIVSNDADNNSSRSLDAGSARKLFFLESWVRFLISRDFLSHFHAPFKTTQMKRPKGVAEDGDDPVEAAPGSFLLGDMQYPLNSLCDRLSQCPSAAGLRANLSQVLGAQRIVDFGVGLAVQAPLQDVISARPMVGRPDKVTDPSTSQLGLTSFHQGMLGGGRSLPDDRPKDLSLDELEAFLEHDNSHADEKKDSDSEENTDEIGGAGAEHSNLKDSLPRDPWVQCTYWEPCAIGSLPGYPSCS